MTTSWSELPAAARDVLIDDLTAAGETCGVCLNPDAPALGRVSGVRLTTGYRHSEPACGACIQYLWRADWAGLEAYILAFLASDWTWREAYQHGWNARQTARRLATCNRTLFANFEPDDITEDHT